MTSHDPLHALAARRDVAAAVAAARDACTELRWHPALRRRVAEVHTEVCVRAAAASAEVAGVRLPLALVRAEVLAGPTPGAGREPVNAVVVGALRATLGLDEVGARLMAAPAQALARLHTLAASGLLPADQLGRPRPEVAQRLGALCRLLSAGGSTPTLVLAAVAYAEIATLDAFPPVSGVLGRAVARGVTTTGGLDPLGVCLPERHVLAGRAGHDAAMAGYAAGGDGAAAWVLWWGGAVVAGVRHGREVADVVLAGRLG